MFYKHIRQSHFFCIMKPMYILIEPVKSWKVNQRKPRQPIFGKPDRVYCYYTACIEAATFQQAHHSSA
nr:MAG TPA: hypothetical protein [Corticoviridae sp.]